MTGAALVAVGHLKELPPQSSQMSSSAFPLTKRTESLKLAPLKMLCDQGGQGPDGVGCAAPAGMQHDAATSDLPQIALSSALAD